MVAGHPAISHCFISLESACSSPDMLYCYWQLGIYKRAGALDIPACIFSISIQEIFSKRLIVFSSKRNFVAYRQHSRYLCTYPGDSYISS